MLVLTRRLNESIVIEGGIIVKVLRIDGDAVKLGITAPKELRVDRAEVSLKRQASRAKDEPDNLGGRK